jgi:hypothetical protein
MQLTESDLVEVTGWRKSRRSGAAGHCVEAAPHRGGVALRNSNDPPGGGLLFTSAEWAAFVGGVRDGDFDGMTA